MKTNHAHAEAGTIGSVNHNKDLSEASGRAKERYLKYQESVREQKKSN